MQRPKARLTAVVALPLIVAPSVAQAYIDPGIVSMAAQALFAVLFGGIAAWITKPWSFVKGIFGRKGERDEMSGNAVRSQRDGEGD